VNSKSETGQGFGGRLGLFLCFNWPNNAAKNLKSSDEIVEEVRKNREAYAAQFNFDLQAIYDDLKKAEQKSKCKKVSFEPKKPVKIEVHAKAG
jgi:hypothetical protein